MIRQTLSGPRRQKATYRLLRIAGGPSALWFTGGNLGRPGAVQFLEGNQAFVQTLYRDAVGHPAVPAELTETVGRKLRITMPDGITGAVL